MGTPAYMPPEQAHRPGRGARRALRRVRLGAILCEILTGKPPYVGESAGPPPAGRRRPAWTRRWSGSTRATRTGTRGARAALPPARYPATGRPTPASSRRRSATGWPPWTSASARRRWRRSSRQPASNGSSERAAWERRAKRKTAHRRRRRGARAPARCRGVLARRRATPRACRGRAPGHRPGDPRGGAPRRAGAPPRRALDAAERAHDLAHTSGVPADLQAQAVARVGELGAALEARRAEAQRAEEARAFVRRARGDPPESLGGLRRPAGGSGVRARVRVARAGAADRPARRLRGGSAQVPRRRPRRGRLGPRHVGRAAVDPLRSPGGALAAAPGLRARPRSRRGAESHPRRPGRSGRRGARRARRGRIGRGSHRSDRLRARHRPAGPERRGRPGPARGPPASAGC